MRQTVPIRRDTYRNERAPDRSLGQSLAKSPVRRIPRAATLGGDTTHRIAFEGMTAMPLLEDYLVQGRRHDLLRAADSTRRFERQPRRRRPRRPTAARKRR
jgi:hypothetical protein